MKFSKAQFQTILLALMLVLSIPVAIFAAKVKVTDDAFTGEKIVNYEFSFKFTEGKNLIGERDYSIFKRTLKNNVSSTTLTLALEACQKFEFGKGKVPAIEKIGQKAFFQINDKVFNINLENFQSAVDKRTHSEGSIDKAIAPSLDDGVTLETYTTIYIGFKPKITITKEMEDALKQAKSVKLRIYADEKPVTMEMKPKDIEKLIEMMNMQ